MRRSCADRLDLFKSRTFNPADLFTKHLDRATIDACMTGMGHQFEHGRNASAPELNHVADQLMMSPFKSDWKSVDSGDELNLRSIRYVTEDGVSTVDSSTCLMEMLQHVLHGYENNDITGFNNSIEDIRKLSDSLTSTGGAGVV